MGEDITAGAGGLHPGRPVIWPTSKSQSQQVTQTQTPQTSGGVRGVPAQTARTAETSSGAPASAATAATAAPTANVARALTLQDIRSDLLKIQIPDTEINMQLAQMMLKYGVELSRSNFVRLMSMMEGTSMSPSVQQAAMALLMKEIDSPEALRILSRHFSDNPHLAAQIIALQESIGNLLSTLGIGKAALNSTLIAQISAMLSQFDDLLKGLPGNYKFSGNNKVSRDALINDVRALKALLEGIGEKAPIKKGGEIEVLQAGLSGAINKLDTVLKNLVSQAVMSQGSERQETNYLFYQIPNSLATPPKNFEIIIKRDGSEENSVDPQDTQVIMSIETHNMGKISIVMRVKDNKVRFLFNTEEKEVQNMLIRESGDLMQKLMDKNFVAEGFQVKVNPTMCNIRPYLIPLIGLDDLLRINVEA